MRPAHRTALMALGLLAAAGCRAANPDPWRWARPLTAAELTRSQSWGSKVVVKQFEERRSLLQSAQLWFTNYELRAMWWFRDAKEQGTVLLDLPVPRHVELLGVTGRLLSPGLAPIELPGEVVEIANAAEAPGGPKQQVRIWLPAHPTGSVVQLVLKVRTRRVETWIAEELSSSIPIEEYLLEVRYDPRAELELLVYNPGPGLVVERSGDPAPDRVRLRTQNLRPQLQEELSPDPKLLSTWWTLRTALGTTRYLESQNLSLWYWAFVNQTHGLEEASGPHLPSIQRGPDLAGCGDRLCQVARALRWLEQDELPDLPPASAGEELRRAGGGQALPRARLLWSALNAAGVPVRWALTAPRGSPTFDPKKPNPVALTYPLLLLPGSSDHPPLWIDPGCTYCRPGEVEEPYLGALAVLGWGQGAPAPFAMTLVQANLPTPSQRTIRWRIRLDGANNSADLEVELAGRIRQEIAAKQQKLDDATSAANVATWIKERSPDASCSKVEPFPKSEDQPVRHLTCTLPKLVRRDGNRWVVPLEMLSSRWDHSLMAERRRTPVEIGQSELEVEELTLELPPGTQVVSTPKPRRVSGELFDVELKVQKIGDTLELRRTVRAQRGRVPVERYTQEKAVLEEARAIRGAELILAPAGP